MRIQSIDIFRALTMVLMIFVNDFWTLEGIPQWLKHMPGKEDGLGFSDIIFPGFLFIVGLSIPFAIDNRLKKENSKQVFYHILSRSFALIIMGVFLVNLENIYPTAMSLPKQLWQVLVIIAFLLIWNNYSKTSLSQSMVYRFIGFGVALLLALAILYRGGNAEDVRYMQRYWWGILGLIGWAYFYSATIYLLAKGKLTYVIIGALFFLLYNLLDVFGMLDFMDTISAGAWLGNGSNQALVMGGVVTSCLYKIYYQQGHRKVIITFLILGIIMLLYGFLVRPYGGISKIRATPAWVGICTGISLITYAFLYWLADIRNQTSWAKIIGPAGRSTLTCYLVPYIYYAIWSIWAVTLPEFIRTGVLGLIKSMLFALLIVAITGLLNKWKISLKI
ncbi:MAG: DUF5009 domain-containing protein [Saprospiraceae bacterium]|nr:DUF5009 domain-containing protein [Saprospiraceae bacterium]